MIGSPKDHPPHYSTLCGRIGSVCMMGGGRSPSFMRMGEGRYTCMYGQGTEGVLDCLAMMERWR